MKRQVLLWNEEMNGQILLWNEEKNSQFYSGAKR